MLIYYKLFVQFGKNGKIHTEIRKWNQKEKFKAVEMDGIKTHPIWVGVLSSLLSSYMKWPEFLKIRGNFRLKER